MPKTIREAGGTTPVKTGPGRVLLTLITPGQGSSGSYTPEVLETAAREKAFPRGTQSHINHDTEVERMDRPSGDLRNLAMVLTEDAYVGNAGSLQAEALVSSAWRPFIEEFAEFIGTSIAAGAEVKESAEGRVVERIVPSPFNRVDLVTVAGRGGKIESILEAAKHVSERSILAEETMASDKESYLRLAVRDLDPDDFTWLEDYDESLVYYSGDDGKLYSRPYSVSGVNATLAGEPTEVRRRVEYDPITSPVTPAGVTENKEEAPVATTQIEEAELATLQENASRTETVTAELTEARKELAEARTAANTDKAERIVAEAFEGLEGKTSRRLLIANALAQETFDAEQLTADAKEAAAELSAGNGAGTPRGLGNTAGTASVEEGAEPSSADIISALKGA